MSEVHPESTGATPNGAAAPSAKKTTLASISTKDNVVTVNVLGSKEEVSIDASKVPASLHPQLVAHAVASLMRMSYQNADTDAERVADLQACAKTLLDGTWRPGSRAASHAKSYDDLTLALAEHLKKDPRHIDEVWLPNYIDKKWKEAGSRLDKGGRKMGLADIKQGLHEHSAIMTIKARLAAERAKAAVTASRGKPPEPMFEDLAGG